MLETIVSLISGMVNLGLKLYRERNDAHDKIIKDWEELKSKADSLESSLRQYRSERDAATLKRLDELEAKHVPVLAASLVAKVPPEGE